MKWNRRSVLLVVLIVFLMLVIASCVLAVEVNAYSEQEAVTDTERDADAECIEAREHALKRRAGIPEHRKNLPVKKKVYLGRYWITGYDICVDCCGKTDGITASGVKAQVVRTVAAPKGFNFGTRLYIDGLGERVVEDRGGAIKGNKLDVLCEDHPACYAITGWYDVYEIKEDTNG